MSLKPPTDPLIAIIGATGTGKSKLAIELAKRFNGEIINGDAMQMYKGLPIITNKACEEEKQNIPHHIFDQIGLEQSPWTVSNFRREAHKTIREIRSRGRLPVLVGGTHYYTQAVLFNDHLLGGDSESSENEEDRKDMFSILDAPTSEILAKLREVDPNIASRWHPLDRRKIQRSLEIWLRTGKTASQTYEEQHERRVKRDKNNPVETDDASPAPSSIIFWLRAQDEVLKIRLDNRVDTMLSSGLLQEAQDIAAYAQHLNATGITIDKSKGIWASIGFKEIEPYLTALSANTKSPTELEHLKETCIEAIKTATRQYARRQERWIRTQIASALTECNKMDTLYPLDSTHPSSSWHTDIQHPAISTTEKFLLGATDRPTPESLSDMARDTLWSIKMGLENRRTRESRYCDVCDKTLMTDREWANHPRSGGHRKAVAGRKKWEAFKAWEKRQAALKIAAGAEKVDGVEGGGGGGGGEKS